MRREIEEEIAAGITTQSTPHIFSAMQLISDNIQKLFFSSHLLFFLLLFFEAKKKRIFPVAILSIILALKIFSFSLSMCLIMNKDSSYAM